MAQMIPDEVPPGKSIGERLLFQRLQRLPDDCIVYYEPIVAGRYPDFVVIMPEAGLLILECKGWRSDQILGGDRHAVRVRSGTDTGEAVYANPIRQARDYKYRLMDECRVHALGRCLLHADGPHTGRFTFPFGSCVVLSQLTDRYLREHPAGDLRLILPPEHVVDAEEFEAWAAFTTAQLQERLSAFFNPTWPFGRLGATHVNALRTILHPEIVMPPTPARLAGGDRPVQISLLPDVGGEAPDIKSLDSEQERVARALGNGHRLLFGVAGSGKTVVLVARARLLSEGLPSGSILVLCYNVTFKAYLQAVLREQANVQVLTFHGWSARNGVRWDGEAPEALGHRLLTHLQSGAGDVGAYDAVLIDEAQDFDPSWFSCAMAALEEPRGGDLLVVGDGSQTTYRRGRVSWKSIGIGARGRTKYLTWNYRNSKEIMRAAAPFADDVRDEDGIGSAACHPASARRETRHRPLLISRPTRLEEFDAVGAVVKGLLEGTFAGRDVPPLDPSDIGILYRRADGDLHTLIGHLAAIAPILWLTPPGRQGSVDPRQRILEPGVKLQTIHSAKGLQYKAVVLIAADQIGASQADGIGADEERRLLYVALTRPEDYLVVSCTVSESRPAPELLTRLVSAGAFSPDLSRR